MSLPSIFPVDSQLALLAPPYERFDPIDTTWSTPVIPPQGLALIWWLVDGAAQAEEFRWLHDRPWGLPLFLVLPPPDEIGRTLPLIFYVNALAPRSVLPAGPLVTPAQLRELLRRPPRQWAATLTAYLAQRQLLATDAIRREAQKIFECVPDTSSVSRLARRMYTSRRTLGRHFAAAGLPVPSHWLQFGRLLQAIFQLQDEDATVCRVASRVGYPDGFTLSNQMKRILGCRPTEVRHLFGWEWIVETWIHQEVQTGGIDHVRHRNAVARYLETLVEPPDGFGVSEYV